MDSTGYPIGALQKVRKPESLKRSVLEAFFASRDIGWAHNRLFSMFAEIY